MSNENPRSIVVNSLKYDNSIRRSWSADLISQTAEMVVLEGIFDIDINHAELGHVAAGTRSTEYYWFDRWYSVFRFLLPSGEFRNYYCNVNKPPEFDGRTLNYVDLDLDVVVWPSGKYTILDQEEFEENVKKYSYPDWVSAKAFEALNELLEMAREGALP